MVTCAITARSARDLRNQDFIDAERSEGLLRVRTGSCEALRATTLRSKTLTGRDRKHARGRPRSYCEPVTQNRGGEARRSREPITLYGACAARDSLARYLPRARA